MNISDIKVFVFAFAVSFLATPAVRTFVMRIGAMDVPKDDRRMHKKPIPSMGGLAIYFSILISALIFVKPLDREVVAILIGASVITVSGVLDDTKGLTPELKVIFQLIAATIVIFGGVKVSYISNFLGEKGSVIDLGIFSYLLTGLWIIGVTNAINLIDGLDGLAAGVSMIAALTMSILSFMFDHYSMAILCLVLAGACGGFLPYNFNPAKIFMGDTGALLLGFMFSVITIEGVMKTAATVAIIVPVIVLAVPISDTFFAIIRRKLSGHSFAEADRGHLHHKILDMGLGVKRTVLSLYAMTAFFGIMAIIVSLIGGLAGNLLALAIIIILILGANKIGMFKSDKGE